MFWVFPTLRATTYKDKHEDGRNHDNLLYDLEIYLENGAGNWLKKVHPTVAQLSRMINFKQDEYLP